MNNSFFSRTKQSSPFKKADILLYLTAIIFVVVAFLCVFVSKSGENDGFSIFIGNEKIAEYDFDGKTLFSVPNGDGFEVSTITTDETVTITVKSGNALDKINVVLVDLVNKSVKITDANCPHGDCVSFSPIKKDGNKSVIYCAAHDLRITANKSGYAPPVSGE